MTTIKSTIAVAKDAKNPQGQSDEEKKAEELNDLFASTDRPSDKRDDLMYCQKKAHNLRTSDRPYLPNSDDKDVADNWFNCGHIPGYR